MSNNDNAPPPAYLPGIRQQPQTTPSHHQQTGISSPRTTYHDHSLGPDDLRAMLMQRLMMGGGGRVGGEETDPRKNSRIGLANPPGTVSLFPGYPVYRCVDEDHKLMREVAKTDQLGNTDQFVISEHVVQGIILDNSLSVVDLGRVGGGNTALTLVPVKTPPLSGIGTVYVQEAAVNRSSGRTLSGQPRRAGNLLID